MQPNLASCNEIGRGEGLPALYAPYLSQHRRIADNAHRKNLRSSSKRQTRRQQDKQRGNQQNRQKNRKLHAEFHCAGQNQTDDPDKSDACRHRQRRENRRQQPCLAPEDLSDLPPGRADRPQHADLIDPARQYAFKRLRNAHAAGRNQRDGDDVQADAHFVPVFLQYFSGRAEVQIAGHALDARRFAAFSPVYHRIIPALSLLHRQKILPVNASAGQLLLRMDDHRREPFNPFSARIVMPHRSLARIDHNTRKDEGSFLVRAVDGRDSQRNGIAHLRLNPLIVQHQLLDGNLARSFGQAACDELAVSDFGGGFIIISHHPLGIPDPANQ